MTKKLTAEEMDKPGIKDIINSKIVGNKYIRYNKATHVLNNTPVEVLAEMMEEYAQSRLQAIASQIEEMQEELGEACYLHDKNGNSHESYRSRCKDEALSEVSQIIQQHLQDEYLD